MPLSSEAQASFFSLIKASRAARSGLPPESWAVMPWATKAALPLMDTFTGLVRPIRSALVSTWMGLAYGGQ